ncbi:MAG: DUF3047 domain-containing protein [Planctomycetes bacterium]|nr:DUF3047 domain-containing protein [Planctomycetota bacterium]
MRRMPLVLILILAGCTTTQSRHVVDSSRLENPDTAPVPGRVIDAFDAEEDWRYYEVEGSLKPLSFGVSDGAMHLRSDGSAGLIWRATRYDPNAEPLLSWRWRVSRTFENSSPLAPEFDNFPARLLVGFDASWRNAGPAASAWRKKVEDYTGVTPPARAICYTFGGGLEPNEGVDAAFGEGRIVVINLRPPGADGEWHNEVRDIAGDYRAIYGEAPPDVMALALGCDSHRRKIEVEAWFDNITAYGPEAFEQFRSQLGEPAERHTPPLVWIIMAAATAIAIASAGTWFWLQQRQKSSG